MIKKREKGFTLVELVIVIGVIAVLAAVLIPTFSSLIRKANISSDTVLAKNLNTAVSLYKAENGNKDMTFDEAIKAVKERGYVLGNLNAKAKDCYFVWEDQSDQFLLIEEKDEEPGYNVLFNIADGFYQYDKTKGEDNKNWCFGVSEIKVIEHLRGIESNGTYTGGKFPGAVYLSIASSPSSLKGFISKGGEQKIYFADDVEFKDLDKIYIDNNESNITLDLNGNTLEAEKPMTNDVFLLGINKGTLTINDGNIETGKNAMAGIGGNNNPDANIVLNNVTIKGDKNGMYGGIILPGNAFTDKTHILRHTNENGEYIEGTKAILNNSSITANTGMIIQCLSLVVLNDCNISTKDSCFSISNSAHVVINGGNYESDTEIVWISNTNDNNISKVSYPPTMVEITGGNFISHSKKIFNVRDIAGGNEPEIITITGGTFNGDSFDELTESDWRALCVQTVDLRIVKDDVTQKVIKVIISRYNN